MESLQDNCNASLISSSFTSVSEYNDSGINQIHVTSNFNNATLDINDEIPIVLNTTDNADRDIVSRGMTFNNNILN